MYLPPCTHRGHDSPKDIFTRGVRNVLNLSLHRSRSDPECVDLEATSSKARSPTPQVRIANQDRSSGEMSRWAQDGSVCKYLIASSQMPTGINTTAINPEALSSQQLIEAHLATGLMVDTETGLGRRMQFESGDMDRQARIRLCAMSRDRNGGWVNVTFVKLTFTVSFLSSFLTCLSTLWVTDRCRDRYVHTHVCHSQSVSCNLVALSISRGTICAMGNVKGLWFQDV